MKRKFSPEIVKVTRMYQALGAETRIVLLSHLMRRGRLNVRQLGALTGFPHNLISHHLKVFRKAGLVKVQPDGRYRWYNFDVRAFDLLRKVFGIHLKLPRSAN